MQFLDTEVERQLVRGTASGSEVQGLLVSRNVPVYNQGTAVAGNKAEQLFRAMNSMRGSAYLEPDWVMVHPTDYETIRLLKDSSGQLYGGGPFFGPYGGPQGPASPSGQVSGAVDSLWSKPCYVSPALGAGTALVGTRAGASVFNRGGASVEASNSHSTYFQYDVTAIRAERRIALCVFRPSGFVEARLNA